MYPLNVSPLNTQPAEKKTNREDGVLDVQDVWYTLQGEGPFMGMPAVFIRLAGCDLQCPACDTDYTSKRARMTPAEVVAAVGSLALDEDTLVVITGGEPFRQNFGPLVRGLVWEGHSHIQVETNGTLFQENVPMLPITIVCSPKTVSVNEKLRSHIKHLKYVVEAGKVASDGLPLSVLGNGCMVARPWSGFTGTVWVQGMEDPSDYRSTYLNQQAAVDSCLKHGYRFSYQIHKAVGVK